VNALRRLLLPLSVSLALVAYLLGRAPIGEIVSAVASVPPGLWIAALALHCTAQFVSSRRWSILARAVGFEHPLALFLRLYFEGMFFNLCLPTAVGGDVVKAVRLGDTSARRVLAGCTVLADRISGLAALATLGTAALAYAFVLRDRLPRVPAFLAAVVLGLSVMAIAVTVWRLGHGTLRRVPRLEKLISALEPYYDRPSIAAQALLHSLVIQLLNVAVVACLGTALGLALPPQAYFVMVPGTAVMTALPVSFGGIGVREASMALLLTPWNTPQSTCIALGILWFSVIFASGLLGGLAFALPQQSRRDPNGPKPHWLQEHLEEEADCKLKIEDCKL
jgi:uncharacterized protein (TIRG00374 family)